MLDVPNRVTHQPSQAELWCGNGTSLFLATPERSVNVGSVRLEAGRRVDIRPPAAPKAALGRREKSRDTMEPRTTGTRQPTRQSGPPGNRASIEAPAVWIESQLEMTRIAKNTTDMHGP